MFDHVRHTLLRITEANRATAPARIGYVRGRLERLESRCLLALAPIAGDSFTAPDWLAPIESGEGAIIGGGFAPTPGIDLGGIPDSHDYQEDPSWGSNEPSAGDEPSPYDPGGLIDIGDLDDTKPDTFGDPASKREELAVMEMLASLNYRPGEGITRSDSQAEEPSTDAADRTLPAEQTAASGQAVSEADRDGGMIAIAADEAVAELVAEEKLSVGQRRSLLDVSVQIDRTHGRFQAFEVSTSEEIPASEIAPDASGARVQPAGSSGAAKAGPADLELPASESLPGETTCGSYPDSEESAACEMLPTATEGEESNGLSEAGAAAVLMTAAGVLAIRVHLERDKFRLTGRLSAALAACRGLACCIADALWPAARAARRG